MTPFSANPAAPQAAGGGLAAGLATRRVVLRVDSLAGPPVSGGCCAVSAEDLVLDELDSWPGLLTLEVDPAAAAVAVRVGSDCTHLQDALEALADRGLPATVLSDSPDP